MSSAGTDPIATYPQADSVAYPKAGIASGQGTNPKAGGSSGGNYPKAGSASGQGIIHQAGGSSGASLPNLTTPAILTSQGGPDVELKRETADLIENDDKLLATQPTLMSI